MATQRNLPGIAPARVPGDLEDFLGLLDRGVMPTRFYLLEQREHLLLLKFYDWEKQPSRKQEQIFNLLVRHGEIPDSPGSISVFCCWGAHTPVRKIRVYDHLGTRLLEPLLPGEFRSEVLAWWRDHA